MCRTCFTQLITTLQDMPDIGNPATRTALLATIPNHHSLRRDYNNTINDLSWIVEDLASLTDRDTNEKLLKIFIENAKDRVKDLTLEGQLKNDYQKYELCLSKHQEPTTANGKITTKRLGPRLSPAYQLCEPQHFDLKPLVDTFLAAVRENQKIVGFAIACDYDNFLPIFRKRLEYAIRGDPVFKGMFFYMERPYTLKYETIKNIIDDIKNKKSSIPYRYIYISIRAENTNIETLIDFLEKMYNGFDADTQHVLVVVMKGKSNSTFPESMIPLMPSFMENDAHDWIWGVAIRLGWPPELVKAQWKEHMLNICRVGDKLDMDITYRYINEVKLILKSEAKPPFEDFFCLLEERSI